MTEPHQSETTRKLIEALKESQRDDLHGGATVDRTGLAKHMRGVMEGNALWTEELFADAAIAYMGARPVDADVARRLVELTYQCNRHMQDSTNWQMAYDKACRERDEQRGRTEWAEAEVMARKAAHERDATAGWSGIQRARAKLSTYLEGELKWIGYGRESPEDGAVNILRTQAADIERLTRELAEAKRETETLFGQACEGRLSGQAEAHAREKAADSATIESCQSEIEAFRREAIRDCHEIAYLTARLAQFEQGKAAQRMRELEADLIKHNSDNMERQARIAELEAKLAQATVDKERAERERACNHSHRWVIDMNKQAAADLARVRELAPYWQQLLPVGPDDHSDVRELRKLLGLT